MAESVGHLCYVMWQAQICGVAKLINKTTTFHFWHVWWIEYNSVDIYNWILINCTNQNKLIVSWNQYSLIFPIECRTNLRLKQWLYIIQFD